MTTTADRGVRAVLARAEQAAQAVGRDDLVRGLEAQRAKLDDEEFRVLVAGEFGRGKSALVNAVVGAPVCGVSAHYATSVPTFIRYGSTPAAQVVPMVVDEDGTPRAEGEPVAVPVRDVARLTLGRHETPLADYGGVEVRLPREILRHGLTLVDTYGLGGGFAATAAATTLRALSGADALLLVTDASAELSASELEFVTEALSLCPVAVCVVTKTDLYPHWRQIVELDREHLARAGLDLAVLPVSSVLRELAIDTGDPAVLAESGFALLSRVLTEDLRRHQRAGRCRAAAVEASSALEMVAGQLDAEQRALDDPAGRERQLAELHEAERHAAQLQGAAARWQEMLADQMRALRRTVNRDLTERARTLRELARQRVGEAEPDEDWELLGPWVVRTANQAVLAHHHLVLDRVMAAARAIAEQFEQELDELPFQLPALPAARQDPSTRPTSAGDVSRVEVALVAARGFTLSGSLMGGIFTTAHLTGLAASATFLVVAAPLAAVVAATFGTVFSARAVRSMRQTQARTARAEVERALLVYLDEALRETGQLDDDLLDTAFVRLRDHFAQLSARWLTSARAAVQAATSASELDDDGDRAQARRGQLGAWSQDVATLRAALGEALGAELDGRVPT